jgi:sugar O-acyltransferase (sialic acid O-acetyltransferase NeuD family)
MTDLLILGVGPHALEMRDIVDRINAAEPTWNLLGFATDDESKVGQVLDDCPVLRTQHALEVYPTAHVVPEYEWPRKEQLPRHRLATLIDPSVFISRTASVGLGCVIYPHCYIGSRARIGDFLFCLAGSVINHNDIIEDLVTITSGVVIAGDVHVETNCYLGQSCSIREQLKIGGGSLIGMGSIVVRDVDPNSVMVGNPARRLRARQPRTLAERAAWRARRTTRKGARKLYQVVAHIRTRLFAPDAAEVRGSSSA